MDTRCCIAGGGPAGMMLGMLLARAGVDVVVLEKHADFLRDFRGDTVHPSTLELMHELGVLDEFLARPHQAVSALTGMVGDEPITLADFSHLPTRCKFIALMPQWDFLDFLAGQGARYPTFHLMMESEVVDLLRDGERITGVRAQTPQGLIDIRAPLTVGADGRHSLVRDQARLAVREFGVPIDVLWMHLPRRDTDVGQTLGHLRNGHVLVTLPRGDYWQCAFVIPKGGYDDLRRQGLLALRAAIAETLPAFLDRVDTLTDWDQVKLLTVKVNRLLQWHRPGLLCIGDAAHAMSPIGGVGINLAIQDAVATANALAEPLREGAPVDERLQQVQRRREFPTRATQRVQLVMQQRVISRALEARGMTRPPPALRLLNLFPVLRRLPALIVGYGFRPEHVQTPDWFART